MHNVAEMTSAYTQPSAPWQGHNNRKQVWENGGKQPKGDKNGSFAPPSQNRQHPAKLGQQNTPHNYHDGQRGGSKSPSCQGQRSGSFHGSRNNSADRETKNKSPAGWSKFNKHSYPAKNQKRSQDNRSPSRNRAHESPTMSRSSTPMRSKA